jgi:hypothetical protein
LPIILRTIPNLAHIPNLEALLKVWWQIQAKQALADKLLLDLPRLQYTFTEEKFPDLMLFDGIDEVGDPQTRQHVLELAKEAHQRGYQVVVTGRPSGYQDLSQENGQELKIYHLRPFVWSQIKTFIQRWYTLRKEWKIEQKQGVKNFMAALQDSHRPYLLTLSRRPIFLTLMALLHCTKKEMPHGRADLYQSIIDLYLDRQERHRQIQWGVQWKAMPYWPENELRFVLGHLAHLSQQKGSDLKEQDDPDARRVIWTREEMLTAIEKQLDKGPGRFTRLGLETEDSTDLLDYFLLPAGLLVEPAENQVQFAHLSFQEYLCAEFLYERGNIGEMQKVLTEHLFPQLGQPGWDEVGMLLLAVRAMKTRQEGHFELLSWLNPAEVSQADLLVNALTGWELSFMPKERVAWLPVLLGCALIHPEREYGEQLARVSDFNEKGEGSALLTRLFQALDDKAVWAVLVEHLKNNKKHHIPKLTEEYLSSNNPEKPSPFKAMQTRWENAIVGLLNGVNMVKTPVLILY